MRFSNELKVGVAIVLAAVIFFVGVRYFEDIPIFSGTYTLYTVFEDASGLIAGNPVRINGVTVGQVERVRLNFEERAAVVQFHLDKNVRIPTGSTAAVKGIEALGSMRLDIDLRPSTTAYAAGDTLPSAPPSSLEQLVDQAPAYADRADSLLQSANAAFSEAEVLLGSPQSDLNRTLRAAAGSAAALERLIRSEQQRLASVLESVDTLAVSLNAVATDNSDSLAVAISNLNRVLNRFSQNLDALEGTTASLDLMLAKINQGEGTLGLLVNDPSLYTRLDTTLATLQFILDDFQNNPRRYLKDLTLIEVF